MIARRGALGTLAGGAALAAFGGVGLAAGAPPRGQFVGHVVAEWEDDPAGRHMKLVQPFAYIDPEGTRWDVPAGAIVDGASIPQPAWNFIGGPFEGRYRAPSVIHDWYCDVRTKPWKSVHRMFWEGMLDAGVDDFKAKVMYYAVYYGGPRWDDQTIQNNQLAVSRKVAELSQDPAPAVLKTCGPDGANCSAVYQSPAAIAATRRPRPGLFEMFSSIVAPHAMVAGRPPPVTVREETLVIGPSATRPALDQAKAFELAVKLAQSRASLPDAEAAIDRARAPLD